MQQQPPNPYPQFLQQQWQQPPMPPQQPQYQPPKKKSHKRLWLILAAVVLVLAVMISVASQGQNQKPTPQVTQQAQPTQIPTSQSIHYPPRTIADLRGLAAKGDERALHEFHSESVGLTGVCPQPKRDVTVNSSVTGKQLAEDLLAYFYANQLDNPCGSVVFAYHNQSESGIGYTAGRVSLDVTDSSGATNLDPNATNLKYTLTLDIGDVATGQEYVVTY